MSLWDALRMNMMISYQELVRTFPKELYEEADACHYDIYEGAFFERVAAVQTQWFKKHL